MKQTEMKKLLCVLTAVACIAPAVAQGYRSVKVVKTDGTALIVDGEQGLAAAFDGPEMTFAVADRVLIAIPVQDVKGWEFSDESGVSLLPSSDQLRISYEENVLKVSGIPVNSLLRLYTLSGIKLAEKRASDIYSLDMSDLSDGVYVLECNGKSVKINIAR